MKTEKILLESLEKVLGLPADQMAENIDLDLVEQELIDSLGIAMVLAEVSGRLSCELDIKKISLDDLRTVRKLSAAIELQRKQYTS